MHEETPMSGERRQLGEENEKIVFLIELKFRFRSKYYPVGLGTTQLGYV